MTTSFKELIKTLEFPFCYYAYVIAREGLVDYFHYGLWETGTKGLKEAQENLASMIKSLIPREVKRILDVGCGLGRTTRDLSALGYDVIGISPDEKLMEMARAKYIKYSPALILSSFEDYKSMSLFDLILFQESAQYIKDLKLLFSNCKELLKKTGYVLICDEVRYENSNDPSFHGKKEIVKTASEYNFNVLLNEDITQKVLKTRSFGLKFILENKGLIISEFSPIRKNAQQEIEFLIEGWEKHSSMFKQNMFGYEVFLFQKKEPLNIQSSIRPVDTVNEKTKGTSMSKETSTIRLYEKGDEQGIVKLFREIFGREMTIEEWKWKYVRRDNKRVYAALAIDATYGIVAHYGGMPHRMIYQGRDVYGLAIGDVMVHPKFRGLKLFKKIATMVPEEAVKDGFILGYGFPNERAMRLPEKLGLYEKVEDIIEGNKEAKFHNDFTRYYFKLFPLNYSDVRIEHLLDLFKHDVQLAVVRDRRYLAWRYKEHPLFSYELWGLKKRLGRRLHGLAVLKKEEHQVLIMDILFAKGMLKPLFQKLENHVCSAGRKTVTLWAPPFMEKTLIENGFSTEPAITSVPRTTHEKTLTKEQMEGKFFYTMGDTDLF